MKKIGLFFGGIGNEHDVSLSSAKNIIKNIDSTKYQIILFYWDKQGSFYKIDDISQIQNLQNNQKVFLEEIKKYIDVALLMTHGKYGEDGVLQGFFERQKIPYCGCRVLSSALCMDKGMFKEIMDQYGINQTKFLVIDFSLLKDSDYNEKIAYIGTNFGFPLYVKPANSGSSVGITKVDAFDKLESAILKAKEHDTKIIIEEGLISPKEIEIGILGNKELFVSDPGELILAKDFYDYEDKYKNNEAEIQIPANIPENHQKRIKELAEKIYRICDCRGFARIDFFLSGGDIYINEINTLPGFTDISMFPMLMKSTGISYTELIDRIISLAY